MNPGDAVFGRPGNIGSASCVGVDDFGFISSPITKERSFFKSRSSSHGAVLKPPLEYQEANDSNVCLAWLSSSSGRSTSLR